MGHENKTDVYRSWHSPAHSYEAAKSPIHVGRDYGDDNDDEDEDKDKKKTRKVRRLRKTQNTEEWIEWEDDEGIIRRKRIKKNPWRFWVIVVVVIVAGTAIYLKSNRNVVPLCSSQPSWNQFNCRI